MGVEGIRMGSDETHTFIASTSLLKYTSITHTIVYKKEREVGRRTP